ncbi:MAG: lysin, partial [Lactobacillus crispatus]|nr:lysin [Lactobacillus crispatus]
MSFKKKIITKLAYVAMLSTTGVAAAAIVQPQ